MTREEAIFHLISKGMFLKPMVLHVRRALDYIKNGN